MLILSTKYKSIKFSSLSFSLQIRRASQKLDVHSIKFIRLARSAKLSSSSSFLKSFTFFKNQPLGPSRSLSSSGCAFLRADISREPYEEEKTQFSLLFLNQGLSSKELTKLRSNLKSLGVTFTHIPTRL